MHYCKCPPDADSEISFDEVQAHKKVCQFFGPPCKPIPDYGIAVSSNYGGEGSAITTTTAAAAATTTAKSTTTTSSQAPLSFSKLRV